MYFALISTDSDLSGLGIRLISAVLRNAGNRTRLIFLAADVPRYSPDILQKTKELVAATDAVGISCYSRGSERARQVATHLRGAGKPVVWGGLHATLNPEECSAYADLLCRGEGEDAIVELAEALASGRDWTGIRNLGYRNGAGLVLNPLRPPIPNLDELPLFDYDREDEFHLAGTDIRRVSLSEEIHAQESAIFIGSRGCAFHCTYCCNRKVKDLYSGKGKYLRRMSPARYVGQLETLYRRYFPKIRYLFLIDEDFLMRPAAELREFSILYKERIGIPFECCGSPPRLTEEKLAHLADAGLWRLRIGVESGSERTKREIYDRPISNEEILRASRLLAQKPSVVAAYFFIIGNPYEERDDLLDTLALMSRLSYPYFAQAFNLVFFPGSALYDRALADGTIHGAWDSGGELHTRVGFEYKGHAWKRKNLYLNALIFLADGKVSRFRLGHLPRFLMPLLTRPGLIQFVDRRPWISSLMIAGKMLALSVRREVAARLKPLLPDPGAVYNLPGYFRKAIRRAFTLHL